MTDLRDPAAVRALLDGTTKGPWERVGPGPLLIYSDAMDHVASVKNLRDTHLIAAAPDLAAALADALDREARLRAVQQWIVQSYDRANPMRTADMHHEGCVCIRCAIDRARAALEETK